MTGSDDRTELGKHKMKKCELINSRSLMSCLHLYPEQQLHEGLVLKTVPGPDCVEAGTSCQSTLSANCNASK